MEFMLIPVAYLIRSIKCRYRNRCNEFYLNIWTCISNIPTIQTYFLTSTINGWNNNLDMYVRKTRFNKWWCKRFSRCCLRSVYTLCMTIFWTVIIRANATWYVKWYRCTGFVKIKCSASWAWYALAQNIGLTHHFTWKIN